MAIRKKYSVSTLAYCDKPVPLRVTQFANWNKTALLLCVALVITGCQSYPPKTNSELAHVVYPGSVPSQPVQQNSLPVQNQVAAAAVPITGSGLQNAPVQTIHHASPIGTGGQPTANPTNWPVSQSTYPVQLATYQQPVFQSPTNFNGQTGSPQSTYQYPATNPPGQSPTIGFQPPPAMVQGQPGFPAVPSGQVGQTVLPPIVNNGPVVADIDVTIPDGPTGRASIGATYGSNNSLVGQFIIDERDFDIFNWPLPRNGGLNSRTFRGGGQTFRAEIVPGTELERYLVSWANPYFGGSNFSLSVSGYYFDRRYRDWTERRAGGRIGFGRTLTNYLSLNTAIRFEDVNIRDPRLNTSPTLNSQLGSSNLFMGSIGLEYDTRFNPYTSQPDPYVTGQGSFLSMTFKQAFGDYTFSRGDIVFRHHRMIYSRPDGSGRHTLGFHTNLGFTGSDTPIFETYLAGGLSSMRGFEFRGVSPIEGGVLIGGDFQWLNSIEYEFPLTADDMIGGVVFVDFGTVEQSVKITSENFRAAPGVGLRVNLPYAGMGAPLAFDWAFPVATATGDLQQQFSFIVGVMR